MKEELYIFIIVLSVICGMFGCTLCCCDMNNSKLNKERQIVTISFQSPV